MKKKPLKKHLQEMNIRSLPGNACVLARHHCGRGRPRSPELAAIKSPLRARTHALPELAALKNPLPFEGRGRGGVTPRAGLMSVAAGFAMVGVSAGGAEVRMPAGLRCQRLYARSGSPSLGGGGGRGYLHARCLLAVGVLHALHAAAHAECRGQGRQQVEQRLHNEFDDLFLFHGL